MERKEELGWAGLSLCGALWPRAAHNPPQINQPTLPFALQSHLFIHLLDSICLFIPIPSINEEKAKDIQFDWFGCFLLFAEHYGGEPPITHHKGNQPIKPNFIPIHAAMPFNFISFSICFLILKEKTNGMKEIDWAAAVILFIFIKIIHNWFHQQVNSINYFYLYIIFKVLPILL